MRGKSTTYTYRVRAFHDLNSAWSNEATATTWDTPPNAPTGLIANAPSQTRIDLTWTDASSNETGFKVERKTGTGGTWSQVGTAAAHSTTFSNTGLTKKTLYVYRVRATNTFGDSPYSNEAQATTKDDPPAAPSGLSATAPAWNQVNLNWVDNAGNEQGFKIERMVSGGSWLQIATLGPNTATYGDLTVVGATVYSYRVRAYNDGGDSAYSNTATVTTPNPPVPTAPTNLVATAVYEDEIRLTWSDNASTETGFRIQRKTGSGAFAFLAIVAANSTGYQDLTVSPSTTYTYRVRAHNAGGNSNWSNEASATTPNGPSGTTPHLQGVLIQDDFLLAGGQVTAVVKLSGRTSIAQTVALRGTDGASVPSSVTIPAGGREATFTFLMLGSSTVSVGYIYATLGDWIQKAKISVGGFGGALSISNLDVVSGTGGMSLAWPAVEEDVYGNTVKGYTVQRRTGADAFAKVNTQPITGGRFIDTTVEQGTAYTYRVVLADTSGSTIATSPETSATFTGGAASIQWVSFPTGTVSGTVVLTATNPVPDQESFTVFVDGSPVSSGVASPSGGGNTNTIVVSLDTETLTDGAHTVVLASEDGESTRVVSISRTLTTANQIQAVQCESIVESETGEFAGLVAKLPTPANFTVTIRTETGTTVRSWSGYGPEARLVWNGTNASGTPVADADYVAEIGTGNPSQSRYVKFFKVGHAPEFLAIVNVKKSYYPSTTVGYADHIKNSLAQIRANNPGLTYAVLTLGEKTLLNKAWGTKLRKWFRNSVSYFYLFGHGKRVPEGQTEHQVWIGDNIILRNYRSRNNDDNIITIPYVVNGRQYKFVWLDCCHTGGSNKAGVPADSWGTKMSRYPHTRWASAFNVNTGAGEYEGLFMGNNGFGYFGAPQAAGGIGYAWLRWRNIFWTEFGPDQNSAAEAASEADRQLESWQPNPNPRSWCNALNKSKRVQAGNFKF